MLYNRGVTHMGGKVKPGRVEIHIDHPHETKEDDRHPRSGKENRRLGGGVLDLDDP